MSKTLILAVVFLMTLISTPLVSVNWSTVYAAEASPQLATEGVGKYKMKGDNAYLDFYSTGDCLSPYITVWAGDSVVKDGPGKPENTSIAGVQISGYDSCAQQYVFGYGTIFLSSDAFSVKGNMHSAILNTVLDLCCDPNGATFPISVTLTWTGTGAISKGKTNYASKSPSCKSSYSSEGVSRDAAVTGNITVLAKVYDPSSDSFARISSSKEGSMIIGCK